LTHAERFHSNGAGAVSDCRRLLQAPDFADVASE
jgi:hypothetical protein